MIDEPVANQVDGGGPLCAAVAVRDLTQIGPRAGWAPHQDVVRMGRIKGGEADDLACVIDATSLRFFACYPEVNNRV